MDGEPNGLLPLPFSQTGGWPHNVRASFKILDDTSSYALRLLRHEDSDPLNLRSVARHIEGRMVPLFILLAAEVKNKTWDTSCAAHFGTLLANLEHSAKAIKDM